MNWKCLLLLLFFSGSVVFAQTPPRRLSILVKAGQSNYGPLLGSFGGGSRNLWRPGPILGAGLEYYVTRATRLQGVLEYSSHPYAREPWEDIIGAPPHNNILELSTNLRIAAGVFYVLAGPGVAWENSGDLVLPRYPAGEPFKVPGTSDVRVTFNLGLGFMIPVSSNVSLIAEGTFRNRRLALQAGLAVSI